ncbi:MAG: ABC transporter ATP-binding protein [Deltaproteobacteria bacterium]|nr:ABC transporter ATP-binding protein [Deltaproteobacteria bacterium]MBW2360368.1 ABC transporter ATP-binding protein [Deltaproteobacteria bacterium]
MVRVENVVKDFRPSFGLRSRRVLHGISFDVQDGEIFGFVGPNGAGKTTTLKVLMGLIRASQGHATILGCDVRETAFRQHVGFLPENPYFYDYLTGREILSFYAKLSGVASRAREGRVSELLDWVGLSAAADARLRTYSKGMLQRVGIAQALVHEPKVVFLDEPMSGLDPIGRKEIRDLILRLRDEGKTVFMCTHILPDVEMLCDRVAIIVEGRVRHAGATDAFLGEGEPEADLVLAAVPADLPAQLEELYAASLRGHGDRLELRVREKFVQDVLQATLGAGGHVVSVTPHRTSLESIFLHAVEESSRC